MKFAAYLPNSNASFQEFPLSSMTSLPILHMEKIYYDVGKKDVLETYFFIKGKALNLGICFLSGPEEFGC